MNAGIETIDERWRELASRLPVEQRQAAWEIYAGGVAVGVLAAMRVSGESQALVAIALYCAGPAPEITS